MRSKNREQGLCGFVFALDPANYKKRGLKQRFFCIDPVITQKWQKSHRERLKRGLGVKKSYIDPAFIFLNVIYLQI